MEIDHLHFYVDNLDRWHQWFTQQCAGQVWGHGADGHTRHVLLGLGQVPILLSAPLGEDSPMAAYLRQHPPGLADVAFRVGHLPGALARYGAGSSGTHPPSQPPREISPAIASDQGIHWCQVAGWGHIRHTLIERPGLSWHLPGIDLAAPPAPSPLQITGVDHAVLNVQQGQLAAAVTWYEQRFGFRRRQSFKIATPHSGLHSQVLGHSQGTATLPINQPTSPSSQVQEFLNHNGGIGIQHVALRTPNILQDVAWLKAKGLPFLAVPPSYYQDLPQRPGYCRPGLDWAAMAQAEILVDWSPSTPQARLLQIFTQPIFDQPTFFFELIERQTVELADQTATAQGFGEGNFQALFEAIEREQMKRGSLKVSGRGPSRASAPSG